MSHFWFGYRATETCGHTDERSRKGLGTQIWSDSFLNEASIIDIRPVLGLSDWPLDSNKQLSERLF